MNTAPIEIRNPTLITGHLHGKIKDLPDGTQVRLKWVE
jgi:hypothetical protein